MPLNLSEEWNTWCSELPELQSVNIPRHLFSTLKGNCISRQIHVFVHASPHAYETVAYARREDADGNVSVQFLMAKAPVAPLKRLTLPRLELLGALIGSRLHRFLLEALDEVSARKQRHKFSLHL